MNAHGRARTCPLSRALLVGRVREQGWRVEQAAAAAGISLRTTHRWLARYREEGPAGLEDRQQGKPALADPRQTSPNQGAPDRAVGDRLDLGQRDTQRRGLARDAQREGLLPQPPGSPAQGNLAPAVAPAAV